MSRKSILTISAMLCALGTTVGGERTVVSLRDMSGVELRHTGIYVPQSTTFRIVARGAGDSQCDRTDSRYDSRQDMFAYGWILNADTRQVVWEMTRDNTSKSRDDRTFDGEVTLQRGSYEVFFSAATLTYISTFKNISVNVDHREAKLFNMGERTGSSGIKGWFGGWFSDWFGDDLQDEWNKRSRDWGIELKADDGVASTIKTFTAPKETKTALFKATKLGENEFVRKNFTVSEPITLRIYALGEGYRNSADLADYGWIVNTLSRERVWEMKWRNSQHAGGASKNAKFDNEVAFPKGDYALYFVTDNSHSTIDWNCAPPYDPLNYGISIFATNEEGAQSFAIVSSAQAEGPVIVSMTKIGDDENRSEGFTLKEEAKIRIYAIGERSNSRRIMADYALILNADTRSKVWTMDADNSNHAGGASKNRFVDEIITLPKGNYIVLYNSDDSHAYDTWNSDQPFDPEHYGVTIYGVGEKFINKSIVGKYVDQRDKNVIAQVIRVGNRARKEQKFSLDKTTKIRVYGIGEGVNREMADYGWITDNQSGATIWETTYSMTFHAGGAKKNRMVNTTIILDRGSYTLHYATDDSHAYQSWNQDPPEDPEYWGISLYPDQGIVPPVPPAPPKSGSSSNEY